MKPKNKDLLFLIVPLVIAALMYPFLPERIPRQFHLNGRPASYMAKEFIFLIALLPFVVYERYKTKKK